MNKKIKIPKVAKVKGARTKRVKAPAAPKMKKPKGAAKLMMKSSMGMRDR